jgi:cell division protein FtsW (lipid II flippase)
LTIPTARLGNRLVLDPRPLVPILLAWVFAIGVMSLEHDIGFSAMLFTLFIGLLWVTTGRTGYLVLGIVLFAVGAYLAGRYLGQTHIRVETWLDPGKYANTSGRQLVQSWFALGSGGIGGSGLGLGFGAYQIPIPQTDFIFAIIGEEMGLLGSTMVVVAFLLLVGAGLRIAQAARSEFAKLTAVGLTMILGFQAFFIIGGVVRLLPLTGITLPFVSYGGSALIANYVLIALLMRISDEGGAAADAADQTQYEQSEERRQRLLSGG